MVNELFVCEEVIDLEKDTLMVWGEERGIKGVGVYSELIKKGYKIPSVNVFLRDGLYHLTGHIAGTGFFEFGGHHRSLAYLIN